MPVDGSQMLTVGKRLMTEVKYDDVSGLAAELSYRFLLALFPLFIFIAALSGFITDILSIKNPSGEILQRIGDTLPADAASVLEGQLATLFEEQQGGLLSFGIVTALWAASGGMKSTMKAMNRAYDVDETRPFFKKTALAIGLTLFTGIFFVGAFALAVVGGAVAGAIADASGVGGLVQVLFQLVRFVGAVVCIGVAAAFLYWAAPNTSIPFRWISPGSIMFVIVWLLATVGFGFYVANFGSYNATYGALGGVVVLLLWFYITAFILLAGAELNALLYRMAREVHMENESPAKMVTERAAKRTAAASGGASGRPAAAGGAASAAPTATDGKLAQGLGALVTAVTFWRATGSRREGDSQGVARGGA